MVDRIRYVSKDATPEQRDAFSALLDSNGLEPDDLLPIPVNDRAVISTAVPPDVRLYLDEEAARCATTRSIVIRALLSGWARRRPASLLPLPAAVPERVEPDPISGEIDIAPADGFG